MDKIIDDSGCTWLWDGERLRVEGSDEEFIAEGTPVEENGYFVDTLEGCAYLLKQYGYIAITDEEDKALYDVLDKVNSIITGFGTAWAKIKSVEEYIKFLSLDLSEKS